MKEVEHSKIYNYKLGKAMKNHEKIDNTFDTGETNPVHAKVEKNIKNVVADRMVLK